MDNSNRNHQTLDWSWNFTQYIKRCSFQGYGFLSTFTFLEKYVQASNLHLPPYPATIIGYCDNSGLIQQINALQTETIPTPSQTLSNNYDLSNKIHQIIQRIPIPILLCHIKGHQNNDNDIEDLPHKAQLNITCNDQAN